MFLDFLIVFIFLLVVFMGCKKGFAQMLISLGALILSVFLVAGIYNFIGDSFFNSDYGIGLVDKVSESVEEQISDMLSATDEIPLLGSFFKVDAISENGTIRTLAEKILRTAFAIPTLIISFLILKILLFSIRKIVSKTSELPVIGTIDSLLGAVLGLIMAVVITWALCFSLGYIQLLPSMSFLREQIESSYIIILMNDIF